MLAVFILAFAQISQSFGKEHNSRGKLSKPSSSEWYDTSDGELHSYDEGSTDEDAYYDGYRNEYDKGYHTMKKHGAQKRIGKGKGKGGRGEKRRRENGEDYHEGHIEKRAKKKKRKGKQERGEDYRSQFCTTNGKEERKQLDVRGCGGWVNLECRDGCLNIQKVCISPVVSAGQDTTLDC